MSLARTGFKRPVYERTRSVLKPIPEHLRRNASMTPMLAAISASIEKDNPIRSEAYRRLVAALPCANCGKVGYSQHAHTNGANKGKSIKNDDRDAMPLCADDLGMRGCHTRFDRYALFLDREEHRRMGAQWAAETRAQIEASGQWPKNLPKWTE
jgi:hypothetical protein